jgi:GDP-4-dehydro-6-deoxy-D-mannose reductase
VVGQSAAGPRLLLTGGYGFVGHYLQSALAKGRPDWVIDRPAAPSPEGAGLDIVDADAVAAYVAAFKPDMVVHLAAVAAVTTSVKAPRLAWDVNLGGTLNLVLALQEHAPGAHLLYVSSAEVYGASLKSGAPATEQALLQPMNPYAASKAAADILVRQAAAAGLSATVMRPFNHTGAGQSESFVAPSFAAQIARIEAGLQPPVLSVGSLDEERDFLDVGDVVRAYALALDARATLAAGEVFNVASGRAVRIGDLLERLLSQARAPIQVRVDPERLRRASIPRAIGDASHLRKTLNWAPTIGLDETLAAVLADQRNRLKLSSD